jgi:hypothetical protein
MVMDETDFQIHHFTGRTVVTISRLPSFNSALREGSAQLHRLVTGCSNGVDGVLENITY